METDKVNSSIKQKTKTDKKHIFKDKNGNRNFNQKTANKNREKSIKVFLVLHPLCLTKKETKTENGC